MNAAALDETADMNVGLRVEQQVWRHPDAIAVIAEQQTATYGQLWARVLALSRLLRAAEITPEENVGVLLGRTIDLVAALLAVWHSGGTLVPIDPDDPALRNRHIIDLARCRLLLTSGDALGLQPGLVTAERTLRIIDVAHADNHGSPLESAYLPGSGLAYVLFTSGSTGLPKGVELEHRSVVALLDCVHHLFMTTSDDRYLATATIGFDVSFAEIFMPLTTGASIVLRHRELWLQPRACAREVSDNGVTVCSTGPSVWALTLTEVPDFPPLRIALSSGEAMIPWVAARLPRVADAAWNVYGPTETTIWCSGRKMPATDEAEVAASFNNIGFPFSTAQVRVTRPDGSECARGEPGEFWFSGIALARGYHRRDDLTQGSFLRIDGKRFYKTGDIGSLSEDGEMFYLGRNDDQMKVRGVRVEPGEVESVLIDHPDVLTAAVTWLEIETGTRSVAAAYVPKPDRTPSRAQLVTWLADRLPAAMMPARWIALDALPQTPSNKVDRLAIRTLIATAQADVTAVQAGDMTPTEAKIAAIWCRVLRIRQVDRNHRFLELGGDSFAMVRMLAGIEQEFGVAIAMQQAFSGTTLRQLALQVEGAQRDAAAHATSDWIQVLVRIKDAPSLFFCGIDLNVSATGRWTAPVTLLGVFNWTPGKGLLEVKNLETLARRQIANIRKHQPAGPYWLGGFSFGGLLALEIARQLERSGEEVPLLCLLDPMPPPASGVLASSGISRFGRWLRYRLTQRYLKSGAAWSSTILRKSRRGADWHYALKTAKNYRIQPYAGQSLLIAADETVNKAYWDYVLPNQVGYLALRAPHYELQQEPWLGQWLPALSDAVRRQIGNASKVNPVPYALRA